MTTAIIWAMLFGAVVVPLIVYSRKLRPIPLFLGAAVAISLIRVGILWIATVKMWTGNQSLGMLPFLLLLYPEALLLPNNIVLSAWTATLFSVVLCLGSTCFAAILAAARYIELYWIRRADGHG
jgi:hypothetical protein